MIYLLLYSFLAGFVTILSPCILPVLPIILSGGVGGDKKKPLGIVSGFVVSFTFFTLFLSTIVKLLGLQPDLLRSLSILIIFGFGLSLLFPKLQIYVEKLFNKLAKLTPNQKNNSGFVGGFLLGLSLGLIWTPCVGPIIATVITLAVSSTVTLTTVLITLSYSLGTAIPMFAIIYGGNNILKSQSWLVKKTVTIQKIFAVIMIATAIGLFFNVDRSFQNYILKAFPQYGIGLTKIEDNPIVKEQLSQLKTLPQLGLANKAPDFAIGGNWINSPPLTMASLKGKVVLIDFWTYTCINCIRTLPHVVGWYEKYKDQGFVVVGIHTPEFEFEKITANVKDATRRFGINYPVLQDNDYKNWNAYSNNYWPAEYLIDVEGKIRRTHFGEGEYSQTEDMIKNLLVEAGQKVDKTLTNTPDMTPTFGMTPETYLGSLRSERNAGNNINIPPVNYFSFQKKWDIQNEFAKASKGSQITFHFSASHVYLVMHPNNHGDRVKIFLDDKPILNSYSGTDVKDGVVILDTERLYDLVNISNGPQDHVLKLEFENDGTECFAFTFG